MRRGKKILYYKGSDAIQDVLTYIGAPVAAMGIMEARLEKDLNNKVNRRCNCDEGNTSKLVAAAQEQLQAIRILRTNGILETLPVKLQCAAVAREANPEFSLTELAAIMEPPITKPAMNNRLKRLVSLAKENFPRVAACVYPAEKDRLQDAGIEFISALNQHSKVDFSLVDGSTLGADRVANAVAAAEFYPLPAAVISILGVTRMLSKGQGLIWLNESCTMVSNVPNFPAFAGSKPISWKRASSSL